MQALRFRNLLDNAWAVYDCLRDGEEKLGGEFIFDGHFVVSLVDAVLENLGRAVFDASVLSPGSAAQLYATYDRLKVGARALLSAGAPADAGAEVRSGREELQDFPEFRMLGRAISWIREGSASEDAGALALLHTLVEHGVRGLEAAHEFQVAHGTLRLEAGGTLNLLRIVAHGGGVRAGAGSELALRDLRSKPLGLMLIGGNCRQPGASDRTGLPLREWYALAGEERIDLWTGKGAGALRLHARLGGTRGDFIFLFVRAPADPGEFVPENFRIEKGELGAACWSFDGSGGNLENDLVHLGRWLFGTAFV